MAPGGRDEEPVLSEDEGAVLLEGIQLVVDDTAAIYPIVVDPLLTSPAWTAESDQANAYFGVSVSTAGDVNNDGYDDVIVGAPDHAYGLVSGIVLGVGELYGNVLAQRYAIPVADFSGAPLSDAAPLTVTFTNLSTPLYGTTAYTWTFGDGATSTLTEPLHVYTQTGVYTVALTVEVVTETHTLTRTNYITVSSSGGYTTTTRAITYTYDPLDRLTGADYSTGESFEYAYDAVGNRTAHTATIESTTVTTYTYDAANRLTKVGDVTYTWDDRGNLTNDGVFTYIYNSAGRIVRAESVTSTLVYTYTSALLSAGTAAGLRVAQSVDGDETTFAWDWASGIPEMLSDGASVYLVGHETLGQWDGAAWVYHLPDALGSVRQVADGAGAVVSAREWTPYGVEVGAAQAGLGYTGEWFDPYIEFTYLRARWYDVQVGRFTQRDPVRSEPPYVYVHGNPINRVDPSGLCAIVGATDCERFVSEIRCMIEGIRDARECNAWLNLISEEALVLDLLAWHYSGIPFTWNGLYLGWVPQRTVFEPGVDRDRWTVPEWQENPRFDWDHPINQPGSELGQTMQQSYGFKRPYFEQTHHYFAFLKFAYHLGGPPIKWMHKRREIADQLQPALDNWEEDNPDYPQYYAWMYRESVYDLYIVDEAVTLAFAISIFGIDAIPDYIESKWCASSEADVWSLESEVDQFYFEFPQEYWPDEQYWPGR